MKLLSKFSHDQQGFTIPTLLSFIIVISILFAAVVETTLTNYSVVGNNLQSQKAFNVAESGINYYLWHMSHNPTDYKDGQATPATPDPTLGYGPYVHNFYDANAVKQGTYTIWIQPPVNGSTVVKVRSIGKAVGSGAIRTIEAQIGAASFASYGVVSDSALWFGNTETAVGPVLSNQGVRMDGANTSTVSSPNATYIPSDSLGGDGSSHPGVWCNASVTTPVNCSTRDKSNWLFPAPAVDFTQVTGSLCTIKKAAFAAFSATSALAGQANACSQTPNTRTPAYLPRVNSSYSLTRGYLIQLNSNNTYDLYAVNGETDTATPYTNALSLQSIATGVAVPSVGVIFAEDNVWVRTNPTFSGRLSIAAGRLASASSQGDIVIADDVLYGTKNGSDALGLIAQDSVLIAPYAPPASGSFNFEVDAAVLAQNGEVMYPGVYRSNSSRCTRGWINSNQTLTFYGSVATRQTWTWTWLDGNNSCGDAAHDTTIPSYISGVEHNSTQFDNNLQYSPPPKYPSTNGYTVLSWREVLTHP